MADPVSVQIEASVHAALSDYCRRENRIVRGTTTSIVKWFLSQPRVVQSAIVGIDREVASAYANAVRAVADSLERTAVRENKLEGLRRLRNEINLAADNGSFTPQQRKILTDSLSLAIDAVADRDSDGPAGFDKPPEPQGGAPFGQGPKPKPSTPEVYRTPDNAPREQSKAAHKRRKPGETAGG